MATKNRRTAAIASLMEVDTHLIVHGVLRSSRAVPVPTHVVDPSPRDDVRGEYIRRRKEHERRIAPVTTTSRPLVYRPRMRVDFGTTPWTRHLR
jgi:hypothetical protein